MKKLVLFALLLACDSPAMIVVENGYADATRVDSVWWSETLVPDAVAPGAASPAYRAVPSTAYAYALLDRGGAIFVARSKEPLSAERGETLHVRVAPDAFDGDCANGSVLPQSVADAITQSIFPAAFDGAIYDAATCKTFRPAGDAGAE